MACLDETTVALFVERRLAPEQISDVEAHIDGCAGCRALLSQLGRDPEAAAGGSDTIGRYVVRRTLGTGGMGAIYAAYDPVLDREIALKLLRPGRAADPEQRARLIHEARAMARVRSPHVVAVYDVGAVHDDVYVAMELFAGGTLRTWLAETGRPRSWREIVDVFTAAGRGLAAAHECGLVHRDFKPDNVLIDRGRVCVADFGLAALRGTAATPDAALDQLVSVSDAIVGTPAYMAPEQLTGGEVDARSDQFSFCVALHEALHGQRPFAGDTFPALRDAVLAGRVRAGRARVPSWLTAAIDRGLAVAPADRHASIAALLRRLERGRARRRTAIAVAGAVALAGGGLALGARVLAGDANPCAPGLADAVYDPVEIRRGLATFPEGAATADHVIARLEAWRGEAGTLRAATCRASRVDGTESPQLADLRTECIADSARRIATLGSALAHPTNELAATAVSAVEHASDLGPCRAKRTVLEPTRPPEGAVAGARYAALHTRLAIAETARDAGRSRDAAELASAIAHDAADVPSIEANAWLVAGEALDTAEQLLPAREALQHALVAAETAGDDRARVRGYLELVTVERRLERDADAARILEQARAIVDRLADDTLRIELATTDGVLASARKDYAAAAAAFEMAIHASGDREDLRLAQLLESHANALSLLGRADEANAEMQRSIAIRERLLGGKSPALIRSFTSIGLQLAVAGRMPEGIALLERAFAIAETAPGYGYSQLPETTVSLAVLLAQLGRGGEAVRYLDRARAPIVQTFGEHSVAYASYLQARSRVQRQVENPHAAIDDARAALAIVRALAADAERRGESRTHAAEELASALEELGQAQRWGDDPKGGIASFTEALALAPQIAHHDWFDAETGLAECDAMLDHLTDAIPHFERAIELRKNPGLDPVEVANAKTNLAQVLLALHRDRARALALLHEARDAYRASPYADVELKQVDEILATVEKP